MDSFDTFEKYLERFYAQWVPKDAPDGVFKKHVERLLESHAQELAKPKPPKMPKLQRALMCFDIESTGLDPQADRILSLGISVCHPDGKRTAWYQLFDPEMPIPPESTEIHGIRDDDVAGKPKFREMAEKILRGLAGKDIVTYNGYGLDLPLLDTEARRAGLKLDLGDSVIVDVFTLYQQKDPRNLGAAVAKYCGRSHEGAHGAAEDAAATMDVLFGMIAAYDDLGGMDLSSLMQASWRDGKRPVDFGGKLYRDSDGDLRYTLAKVRDVKVCDDPGFGEWMLRQSSPPFPASTCDALRAELERVGV